MPSSPNKPIKVEDLLKLKRHESPDSDFWEQFDQDFERRRLRVLMTEESVPEKMASFRWVRGLFLGGAGFATAAAAVWVLAFQTGTINFAQFGQGSVEPSITAQDQVVVSESPAFETSRDTFTPSLRENVQLASARTSRSAEFVIDALIAESDSRGFESVHANPVFSGQSYGSAQFVSDSYGQSDRFEPTFTVERAIARF
tara:strand:- start:583 stop:1182 length:600 start_codon:yes stop_codon:yes gene_type:complete